MNERSNSYAPFGEAIVIGKHPSNEVFAWHTYAETLERALRGFEATYPQAMPVSAGWVGDVQYAVEPPRGYRLTYRPVSL